MNQFLETLKSRLTDAQKRFANAQQAFQKAQADMAQFQQVFMKAQAEFQAAAQEFNSWQTAVNIETNKEQSTTQAQPVIQVVAQPALPGNADAVHPPKSGLLENNKTEAIRQILRQHPAGITPRELWKQATGQVTQRPYLYSILKRLKDRDEVTVRRGKYILKVAPVLQEGGNRTPVIQ